MKYRLAMGRISGSFITSDTRRMTGGHGGELHDAEVHLSEGQLGQDADSHIGLHHGTDGKVVVHPQLHPRLQSQGAEGLQRLTEAPLLQQQEGLLGQLLQGDPRLGGQRVVGVENGLVPSAGDKNGVQAADTLRVRVDEAEVDLPRPDPGRVVV